MGVKFPLSRRYAHHVSLPYRGDARSRIEAAYRENMGHSFDDGEPRPGDFDSGDEFTTALRAYLARRDQFLYSPRAKNRQTVLELARA